jgi:hypothetical protein
MQNETRTVFNEITFTNLCKSGVAKHGIDYNKTDVYFTKEDIRKLA